MYRAALIVMMCMCASACTFVGFTTGLAIHNKREERIAAPVTAEEREACREVRDQCSARAIRAARTPRPSGGTIAGYTLAGLALDVLVGGALLASAISSTPSH